ncbi:NAD(P)H-dependent oxidoreductase subunit E [Streptomyces sp. ISL-100]|uniref:NAD(P)H-dependent oxidoreductase subunit E n=1 Tax=Streptomyces sp. ISL-100 TaxID=2819173 RepID=UPI001BECC4B9|nr:NAD(P)H-dependent oxidoreductase subunit E [Streptomyces sp. ISL-100]MBT2397175.1 NAD(P)H-dependent oxidoreductase subunit E [Streptomyces sp. ISL-100]
MDLKYTNAEPSEDERAAVDGLLGPPESAWEGADRSRTDLRWARGGAAARERRDLLLPALHAVNDRVGWLSEGALDYICRRLTVPPAEAYGVATFYAMFSVKPRPAKVLYVCTDLACAARGAGAVCAGLEERVGAAGSAADGAVWQPSPCLGLCERAPAALLLQAGAPAEEREAFPIPAPSRNPGPEDGVRQPANPARPGGPSHALKAMGEFEDRGSRGRSPMVTRRGGVGEEPAAGADVAGVTRPGQAQTAAPHPAAPRHRAAAVIAPATADALVAAVAAPEAAAPEPPATAAVPQAGGPGLVLLRRVGSIDPYSLDAYRAAGGYTALRRAFALGPADVIREVLDAGLVGRGGAAFPTGRKWEATARQPDHPHYLVCNADESEPGTFKDRVLMEGDPYALVEAMTIAGYATGAHQGYLYLRGEYPRSYERLTHAITQARHRGLLGPDVLGHGYAFDIEIRRGAGAYICGEETAIFNSIEGQRGEPRSKPPFPVEKGLFGKPTAVNNVETLANVLPILTEGAAAYARTGTESSTGTKLFCVSGQIERPGIYELPFGARLRDLLELAGGPPPNLRAVLLGGAAGGFVRPDELDIPLTFEGTRAAGATLGSGVVLVLDDPVELPAILLRIAEFFRDESCGQCVPCRVGTVRQEEALHRIKDRTGAAAAGDIALLREVGGAMRDASICGLGQTAWNAVESAIDRLGAFE